MAELGRPKADLVLTDDVVRPGVIKTQRLGRTNSKRRLRVWIEPTFHPGPALWPRSLMGHQGWRATEPSYL
jgi:hypothetical protein